MYKRQYHFHERLNCLYAETGAHSTQVGAGLDAKPIYGKWEDYEGSVLPQLDACGGHFGTTPDSQGEVVYHYHVQPRAPFTIGCFGPATTGAGAETLVTLEACRSLYSGCQTTDPETVTTSAGASDYALWCPCYDGQGSNVGTATLAVFAAGSGETVTCSNCSSGGVLPTGGTGGGRTPPLLQLLQVTVCLLYTSPSPRD